MEISRLDEERYAILEQMIYYRQYIETKISRELIVSKENDMFKHLKVDIKTDPQR